MKLELDLIPSGTHFKNVRSMIHPCLWDGIRKAVYRSANYRCEICGGRGPRHPVECHEVWEYEDGIQRLVKLIALCPDCHGVKHFGLSELRGRGDHCLKHLAKVNNISLDDAVDMVNKAFKEWSIRSGQKWEVNIDNLHKLYRSR